MKSINEDGTLVLEAVDMPSGGSGGAVDDVQINGKSIVGENGVAEIPRAENKGTYGLVKVNDFHGVSLTVKGILQIVQSNNVVFDNFHVKGGVNHVITVSNFDYSLKTAMCDGKGEAWTADEQKASRERQGAEASMSKIIDLTTSELVSTVEIFVDDNNNAFDLQDFELHIHFPSDYSGSQYSVYLYLQSGDTKGIALNTENSKPAVSDNTATNFLKVTGGNGIREYEFIKYDTITKCHKTMNPSCNRCQFIEMHTYDASTFPIGTRIVLWKRG